MRTPGLLLAGWLVTAGCPKGDRDEEQDPWRPHVATADEAWRRRGQDGFDPVVAALDEAFRTSPNEPEVLWRLARLHVALGLVAETPRDAIAEYAAARAIAIDCLDLDAGALQRRADPEAVRNELSRIGERRAGCLAYATVAWSRWFAEMGGAAAAIDLPMIDALLDRADALGAPEPGLAPWARGLLAATRPEGLGHDHERARALLERAIEAEPGDWTRRADLIVYVAAPDGDTERIRAQLAAMDERQPNTPEDRRAVERARAATR